MTILDIIKITKWKDVRQSLMYFYDYKLKNKNLVGFKKVFDEIKIYKKGKPDLKNEMIEIGVGRYKGEKDWYSIATNKYSLSFRKWRKLVNIPISNKTLEHHTNQDILAHFIWEITYNGFSQRCILGLF